MNTLPVWWLNLHPDVCHPRDTWDIALVSDALDGVLWPTRLPPAVHLEADRADWTGAVVMVNGGHHYGHADTDAINERLSGLEWAVVFVTSDEGSRYPIHTLALPERSRLWVMTPRPDRPYPPEARFLGEGLPPGTRTMLADTPRGDRSDRVYFAGQVNHPRRHAMWAVLKALDADGVPVDGHRTDGFAQGFDRADYLARLAAAKVVACPSGPVTPDSFRAYEAMEAGCVPILDATAPDYPARGYWPMVAPGCPAPLIGDWVDLPKYLEAALEDWPALAADVAAWWARAKRDLALNIAADVAEVAG